MQGSRRLYGLPVLSAMGTLPITSVGHLAHYFYWL
ncbi:hypothetical protein YPC_1966 [Yersinia pestis biovar Medievalis str. Harbin 35]|nr:hypothetical protein YPC_1966 [Yersinia pestis biovar Medievalis str. Harbin 35]EEO76697.1 hypothetical protein YP516_1995 [Yersinia pestis Nepal516]EEO80778.1 hypothetical protein YPF_2851 [Yersinia pestis biovar Orientalis str. India 195]EEO84271.1 hypothetical protein YPH_0076 [Yersinia pestis biovar Orientalis str. PEXU2]EEO90132.1 hypothetical protein YPS_2798 [Yersinia pestis Pestoides A]